MILDTVVIKANNAKGKKIINKSDFIAGVHELYKESDLHELPKAKRPYPVKKS